MLLAALARVVIIGAVVLALPAVVWLAFWLSVFSLRLPKKQKRAP